ncbi:gliding motility lipoprotein GldB [uncultured Algibacter sp.]|uniref:gliding motility lipoprotein GldB n=1 Tax=uncultured Algibacter sp. TaxID=298659 RepID=UPI00262584FC|nr:gliding motility lipoprotein GldB [uncultured Algibacter sp.]
MRLVLPVFFVFSTLISCNKDDKLEDEIARINTDIEVERFDRLFATVSSESLSSLKASYPFMFSEKYSDTFWLDKRADTLQVQLFGEVHKSFSDFEDVELEIEDLFNHLKYYFSEFRSPRIITVTNDVDYRNRVIVTDTIAVIALDAYLGSNHEFYGAIPRYQRNDLKKEQIVVDLATKYSEKLIFQPKRKSLLDEMIYFGKQLYFKDVVIPFKSEAERIGYSESELDWARANEDYIWRYFVEHELLYSTDSKLPSRFINPAPFTKFYLEEIDTGSPGRLGQYIGWQIVRAYMNNNDVSLRDMIAKDPMEIFNKSKFKPRR